MSSIFSAMRTAMPTESREGRSGSAIPATADAITVLDMHRFGRSNTCAYMRRLFDVDLRCIARAATGALAAEGKMNVKDVARAFKEYKSDAEKANPIGV